MLEIGTILTMEPSFSGDNEKLQCRVLERKGDLLYIDYPQNIKTKKTVFLTDGSQFRVIFNTESNETYSFHTEVVGRVVQHIPMIILHLPKEEDFIKIQRREFVRVHTPLDVAVNFNNQFYQFVTEDISAGGLAIKSKTLFDFQEGDELELSIVLPFTNGDIKYIVTEGKVMRIFERDDFFIASMQFTDIGEFEQRLIVRLCFERQLLMRKKGIEI